LASQLQILLPGHVHSTDEDSCAEAQKTALDDFFPKPFVKMMAALEKAAPA
jgi:hypothetical protein